jgi:hypothetical protein
MRWIAAFLLLGFISCQDKSGDYICTGDGEAVARIVYTGPPAADGCGWMVYLNGTYYSPVSIPFPFQKTDMDVKICYKVLEEKIICGLAASEIPVLRILRIRKAG